MKNAPNLLNENENLAKVIWYLAWPTILEQLLITFVQYADTAMVGTLGPQATAAVAVTISTSWLVNGILMALAVGFSVLVGRNIGAGRIDYAKEIVRQAVGAILIAGSAAFLITFIISPYLPSWLGADKAVLKDAKDYFSIITISYFFNSAVNIASNILRCAGDTRRPMIFNILANVFNVILNFFLIYESRYISVLGNEIFVWGAGLGVRGAAIATVIALACSSFMLVRALFSKDFIVGIPLSGKFSINRKIWHDALKLSAPVAAERITISSGQIVMTSIVAFLGTIPLAAHHLAITAEAITYLPAYGFSAAATTLVAQSLGAEKQQLAKKYSSLCVKYGVLLMSIMGVVLFVFSKNLMSIFTPSNDVISTGALVLKLEAFAQPFFAISMVISGVLRGSGKTKYPFIIGICGMWLVRLPIAYFMSHYTTLALFGAWLGMVLDILVRGILSYVIFKRGKWSSKVI